MRIFFNGLVLGIILGALGFWFVQRSAQRPEAQQPYKEAVASAITNAIKTASSMSDALHAKQDVLGLRSDQITDELKKKGEIVRRKAQAPDDQAVDPTSDARAVAETKAKYAMDPALSVTNISVTCAQGHVIISGVVSSPDDIGKAVAIALDAAGVRDVTSTLTEKPKQ